MNEVPCQSASSNRSGDCGGERSRGNSNDMSKPEDVHPIDERQGLPERRGGVDAQKSLRAGAGRVSPRVERQAATKLLDGGPNGKVRGCIPSATESTTETLGVG